MLEDSETLAHITARHWFSSFLVEQTFFVAEQRKRGTKLAICFTSIQFYYIKPTDCNGHLGTLEGKNKFIQSQFQ